MKIVVQDLQGVSISTKGVCVDYTTPGVLEWIDMLATYKEKFLRGQVPEVPEPIVPHAPGPEIGNLLRDIFYKK